MIFARPHIRVRYQTRFSLDTTVVLEVFAGVPRSPDLSRDPARTQLEFAAQVRERFTKMPDAAAWPTDFPARIADSFYSVRFGGNDIDTTAADAINSELDGLEERIRQREATNHKPR